MAVAPLRQGERDLPELPKASTSAISPSQPRRGHLKQLSLSSVANPISPETRPGGLPGRTGHTPRHLRLSLAGAPAGGRSLAYNDSGSAPPSTTSANTHDGTSFATPEKCIRSPRSPNTPASPLLGTISEDGDVVSPLSSRRPPSTGQIRTGRVPLGHARRQSSISYRSSSSPISPYSPGPNASPAVSPLAARTTGRPMSGFFSPDMVAASRERMESTSMSSPPIVEAAEPPRSHSEAPTMLEQHGDLLSTIAEKERKCLDLREELKKEEAELKTLKTQWEMIVARDVASARKAAAQAAAVKRATPVTSPAVSRQNSSQGSAAVAATTMSLGATDALPLAVPSDGQISPAALPDMGSAKRWVGGLMAGVSGILENLAAPIEELPPPTSGSALGMVVEGDEDEATPLTQPKEPSSPDSSTGTDRRQSTADDFFDDSDSKTRSSSVSSINSLSDTVGSSSETLKHDLGLARIGEEPSASWSGSSESSEANRTPTPTQQPGGWLEQAEAEERRIVEEQQRAAAVKHNRRRSTFDMLGQTASSWTSGFGKRLADVAGSETFRSSKRATLSFVDTFERTLADAINIEADGSPRPPSTPNQGSVASPRLDAGTSPRLPSGAGLFGYRPPSLPPSTPKAQKLDVLSEESDGDGDIASSPLQPAKGSPRARLPQPIVPSPGGSAARTRVRSAHARRLSILSSPQSAATPSDSPEEVWDNW